MRLLLAEDDPLVRAVLLPVLEDLGFQVEVVERGDEALAHLERERYSLVISDMKMPGATGLEVLTRARERDDQVRLVAISGYADEEMRSKVAALGGRLLHKPFGLHQLREALSL